MSKHLVNKVEDWAKEAVQGYLQVNNRNLVSLKGHENVVIRSDWASVEGQVAILSGGGSGHEPAHLGFVGRGMLTGVICGDLFASPSTAAILSAIRAADKKSGVLLIVKNYTGDRLNFGLAAKKAQLEGIEVDWVLVDDDVSLENTENSTGKRGLAGTILIEKIAGALSEQKKSLNEIKVRVDEVLIKNRLRTLGVSLSGRVQLPGEAASPPSKTDDLIEVGLGIHGEAGRTKIQLKHSAELVQLVFDDYLLKNEETSEVCLLVNNLGGLSNLELHVLVNDCVNYLLERRGSIKIRRVYAGGFMTSLNMNGFSVTLLSLDGLDLLGLLDAETAAPYWLRNYGVDLEKLRHLAEPESVKLKIAIDVDYKKFMKLESGSFLFKAALIKICDDLVEIKERLNELDSVCGDGDCGNSLSKIAVNVRRGIEQGEFDFEYPSQVFIRLSEIFENGGGSLCILLALFFSASVNAFRKLDSLIGSVQIVWARMFLNALELGVAAVQEYGRAKPNQRSIVDPLCAVKTCLSEYVEKACVDNSAQIETGELLANLAEVAQKSAEATAKMAPRVGRASYVDPSLINSPDAGATAISSIFSSIKKSF